MLIAGRETHLFNPYTLKSADDNELLIEINKLADKWKNEPITPNEIAYNIDVASDLLIIYGEFISRLTEQVALIKLDADIVESKQIYQLRKDWKLVSNEKPPAMSYFEAQASESVAGKRQKQYSQASMLTRFKYSYESLESKMNAQKKKLEAMRYEEL